MGSLFAWGDAHQLVRRPPKEPGYGPLAELEIKTDTGPLLAIDGHNGIGQYITNEAVDLVAARAKTYGIACASIARSGHFGTAMYYTKRLADKNMIGFLATNASPAMAPHGGAAKLVGNNLQSWSAPTALDAPFILDIAHTEVARGKIYLAKEKKKPSLIIGHRTKIACRLQTRQKLF